MPQFVAASGMLGRKLFEVDTNCTLVLRKRCREHIGRRRSARMTYHKIGANSFQVRTPSGRVLMEIWKKETSL